MSSTVEKMGFFRRFLALLGMTLADNSGRAPAAHWNEADDIGEAASLAAAPEPAPQTGQTPDTSTKTVNNADRFKLAARIASVAALNKPVTRIKPAPKKVIKRHVRLARPATECTGIAAPATSRREPGATSNVVQLFPKAAKSAGAKQCSRRKPQNFIARPALTV